MLRRELYAILVSPWFQIGLLASLAALFRQRWLAKVTLGFLSLLVVAPLPRALVKATLEDRYASPPVSETADYAVVLGGTGIRWNPVTAQYQWSSASGRFLEAYRLYRAKRVKKILFSSYAYTNTDPLAVHDEIRSIRRLSADLGIPAEALETDPNSHNTCEHAANLRALLAGPTPARAFLITSAFHLPRAVAVFEKAGLKMTPFPYYDFGLKVDWAHQWFQVNNADFWGLLLHEWLGNLSYRLMGCA